MSGMTTWMRMRRSILEFRIRFSAAWTCVDIFGFLEFIRPYGRHQGYWVYDFVDYTASVMHTRGAIFDVQSLSYS